MSGMVNDPDLHDIVKAVKLIKISSQETLERRGFSIIQAVAAKRSRRIVFRESLGNGVLKEKNVLTRYKRIARARYPKNRVRL
jgi:hypothetical protein